MRGDEGPYLAKQKLLKEVRLGSKASVSAFTAGPSTNSLPPRSSSADSAPLGQREAVKSKVLRSNGDDDDSASRVNKVPPRAGKLGTAMKRNQTMDSMEVLSARRGSGLGQAGIAPPESKVKTSATARNETRNSARPRAQELVATPYDEGYYTEDSKEHGFHLQAPTHCPEPNTTMKKSRHHHRDSQAKTSKEHHNGNSRVTNRYKQKTDSNVSRQNRHSAKVKKWWTLNPQKETDFGEESSPDADGDLNFCRFGDISNSDTEDEENGVGNGPPSKRQKHTRGQAINESLPNSRANVRKTLQRERDAFIEHPTRSPTPVGADFIKEEAKKRRCLSRKTNHAPKKYFWS